GENEIIGEVGNAEPDGAVVPVPLCYHSEHGGAASRNVHVRREQAQRVVSRLRPGDEAVSIGRSVLTADVADRQSDFLNLVGYREVDARVRLPAYILYFELLPLRVGDRKRPIEQGRAERRRIQFESPLLAGQDFQFIAVNLARL